MDNSLLDATLPMCGECRDLAFFLVNNHHLNALNEPWGEKADRQAFLPLPGSHYSEGRCTGRYELFEWANIVIV